jgi:acetyl-CoA carboxylase carboxyl transferase subunit beta
MTWLAQQTPPRIRQREGTIHSPIPDNTWEKCEACLAELFVPELLCNSRVCQKCSHHLPLSARLRVDLLLGTDHLEISKDKVTEDPLGFIDLTPYPRRVDQARAYSNESEALITAIGDIHSYKVVVAAFEYKFMGGSMGAVVGERFVQAVDVALEKRAAFVCVTASGGARMQEGLIALMQMAKTTSAIVALRKARLPSFAVLTNPTMGGVSASFCFNSDIVIAEPAALIGFAGSRVIEQTVREKLPSGFQRAEFLMKKGAIDLIVDRREQRQMLGTLIGMLKDVKR